MRPLFNFLSNISFNPFETRWYSWTQRRSSTAEKIQSCAMDGINFHYSENQRVPTLDIFKLRELKRELKTQYGSSSRDYLQVKTRAKELGSKSHPFMVLAECKKNKSLCDRYLKIWDIKVSPWQKYSGHSWLQNRICQKILKYWNLDSNANVRALEQKMFENFDPTQEACLEYCEKDPFPHGTNISIFAFLPKTDQKIISVSDMLKRNMAPMSGELFQGGLCHIIANGSTAFSRLMSQHNYPFSSILNYATGGKWNAPSIELTKEMNNLKGAKLAPLNEFLVKLIRDRQWGSPSLQSYPPAKLKKYTQELKNLEQLVQNRISQACFIVKSLRYKQLPRTNQEIHTTSDFIEQLMGHSPISSTVGLWFLKQFELPNTLELITPETLQEMKDKSDKVNDSRFLYELDTFFTDVTRLAFINNLMEMKCEFPSFVAAKIPEYLKRLQNFSLQVKELTDQCCQLLESDQSLEMDQEAKQFVIRSAPLVLFSQNEELIKASGYEYRSTQPLTLGREITMIACQKQDRQIVEKYLTDHRVDGVLIGDLDFINRYTLHY